MKAYVLDNGWLECDSNWMVAMSVGGTASDPTPAVNWIKIPVYAVLVDHPDGKILYDTGCHPEAMAGYWPEGLREIFPYYFREEQAFERQLALAGATPGEIKTVVMSHMHLDHAGNLRLFPGADVYVHRRDFEYGQTLTHQSPDPAQHGAYVKADLEAPVKQYRLVEGDCELAPGVELVDLPGHTPGLLGLVLHIEKSGTVIFPQDAVYQRANYGPPAKASGIVHDSLAFFRSIEKVRALQRKHNARVMFSHDMEFFENSIRRAPDCYE